MQGGCFKVKRGIVKDKYDEGSEKGMELYDVIGIGIGPYNLGLAALSEPVDDIKALFFEQNTEFEWHPGMLIEGTDLQDPFLVDLVTFADPTSPYTFLNYVHKHNRLYQFYFFSRMDIPRREYNQYAKWVANQLSSCRFGKRVIDVIDHEDHYEVMIEDVRTGDKDAYYAKHVVIGTGNTPLVPSGFEGAPKKDVIHTSGYVPNEKSIKHDARSITVIGSGQSAAEVFYDLLQDRDYYGYKLTWFTRTPHFYQMEQSKLAREAFSPDYVRYFHSLPFEKRTEALSTIDRLRHGTEGGLLNRIYDTLYHRSVDGKDRYVRIQPSVEVNEIHPSKEGKGYTLSCHQEGLGETFHHETDKVILATGYKPNMPKWLERYREIIIWEDDKRFKVARNYHIEFEDNRKHHLFTLMNLEHSHGSSATNLGLSVQRNQMILNTIAKREVYPLQTNTVFQQYDL